MFDKLEDAIDGFARGEMVIVVDDDDREAEGDLIIPAASANSENIAFMVRYGTGIICAPMPGDDLDRLKIPPMVENNEDRNQTAFTVSVEAAVGVTTGVSAADRATTIRMLARPDAQPADFHRPGHVFPLREAVGGIGSRQGHTEAGVELCRMAGWDPPVAAIVEIADDNGAMMRLPELSEFSTRHGIKLISVGQILEKALVKAASEGCQAGRGGRG